MLEALDARVLMAVFPPGVFDNGSDVVATVTADFNGDGKLDLAVSAGHEIALLRGRGDGTFRPAAPTSLAHPAGGLAAGQFLEGGGAELVSVGSSGMSGQSILRLLRYDPSAQRFVIVENRRVAGAGIHAAAVDFKGDERDEIVLTAGVSSTLFEVVESEGNDDARVLRYQRMLTGDTPLGRTGVGDFNGDGRSDLMVLEEGARRIWLLTSGGGDTPEIIATTLYQHPIRFIGSMIVGDVNGDGLPDVLFTAPTGSVIPTTTLFAIINPGAGPVTDPVVMRDLDMDLDNIVASAEIVGLGAAGVDGWREVLIHRVTRTQFFYQSRGSTPVFVSRESGGVFGEAAGYTHKFGNELAIPPIMAQGDFAGDGRPDVIWTMRTSGPLAANNRVRVLADSATNAPPTVESPRARFTPVARGENVTLLGRPMDAEFLLGRAAEPEISFYLDTNSNGVLDNADRHMVTGPVFNFRLDSLTGLSVTVGLNWEVGTFSVFARAVDSEGAVGSARRLNGGRTMGLLTITA